MVILLFVCLKAHLVIVVMSYKRHFYFECCPQFALQQQKLPTHCNTWIQIFIL